MASWGERLEAAVALWREEGDRRGAAAALRGIVVAADGAVAAEASHVLGLVLAEDGDQEGARAAHRSVVAGGHPRWAQRSAIVLGTLLMDEGAPAMAWRPLRIAASGADPQLAGMAELSLAHVLRELGDPDAAELARRRALNGGDPAIAELAAETGEIRPPDDRVERERGGWEAFESIVAVLEDEDPEAVGTVLTALNAMLSLGAPQLCTQAATWLYSVHARLGEFDECRRVMEHAIAVGDPAERCRAEKLLGAALLDLGERAEALEAYRRAAEDHRPEVRLDALIEEAKLVRELGDEEEARRILRRVVESGHPEYALEARACLGQVLSEAGEVEDAVECWRIIFDSESEFRSDGVHFLGALLHGLPDGDPRRAGIVELLDRAARFDDPDVSFRARLLTAQADLAERGPDEEVEQAVDDCDAALERLRAGEVGAARTLLRRVIDAGLGEQSTRAMMMLSTLELGEGDTEQADELLEYVADGDDLASGFAAAVQRHLIGHGEGGRPHPVLAGLVEYQRLGREIGIARYEEAARHPDPAVSAPAKNALAQAQVWLGAPLSRVAELFGEAAAAGVPAALSEAAVLSWLLRSGEDAGEVVALLRRAHADGEPALAPWVAQALGAAVEERDPDAALAAYESVSASGHPGLAVRAEAEMARIFEERGDRAGAAEAWAVAGDGDDYAELLQDAVKALLAAGRATEARDLQAAAAGEGPHVDVLLGWNLHELGDHDAAAACFEAVIACGAEDGFEGEAVARASVLLARIVAGRGDAAEAVRHVRHALVLFDRRREEGDPDAGPLAAEAAYDLGEYLTASGDGQAARHAYEQAASGAPGLVAARARERLGVASPEERAVLAAEDGDRPRAVGLLTREHGEPLLAELHLALCEGDDEAARGWLRRSAGTGHAAAAAELVGGTAVQRLQQWMNGAQELYEAVLEYGPPAQVAVVCEHFGYEYGERGDTDAAIEALEHGAAVDHPEALGCLRRLIETLESLDDHPALEPAARRAAASGDAETVGVGAWALADLLRNRGDHAGALPWYRTALENARPENVAPIRAFLGFTLRKLGETEAAYAEFETLLDSGDHAIALMTGVQLGGWLAADDLLARAAEAFGAAAAAGTCLPAPNEHQHEVHQQALNNLGSIAALAEEEGDAGLAVRALWLAAAGGAPDDAVSIAEKCAAAADGQGDRAAARIYRRGAAAFPMDGPPDSPGARHAENARHAAATGDHETAMRLLRRAAGAGEHSRVVPLVHEAALFCTADADVPHAHAYYALGLELAGERTETAALDRMRLTQDDLPAARPELTALYTALTGGDGGAIGVLAGLRGTAHFEAACQTVIAVAKARADTEPDRARGLLRPVAEMAPPEQAVRAWDELGSLADDADEAVHAYERAASIDHPAAHAALRHLIRTLYEQNRPADTVLFATRATATGDPLTVAYGHRLLGLVREKQDDLDGAMREVQRGMAAARGIEQPEFPSELRLDFARLLQMQGDTEAATAEVEGVLATAATEQQRAKAVTYLGNIAVLGGDLAAAAASFAKVAAMEGDADVAEMADGAANNLLGIANSAYDEGRHELAVHVLALAARTSGRDLAIGVVETRTTELAAAGDLAAAMLYLDAGQAFRLAPDEEIRLADLYALAGRPDRAREVYERLAAHPDEGVRTTAGSRLVRPSDGDDAPGPATRWLRADDLVDAGEYAEAREILAPLAEDGSRVARHARLSLGRTYHDEDPARARALYLAAIETPGGQSDQVAELAKMYLGSLAKEARDWPEALRWYQAVIDSGSSGNGPMAAAHLGELAYWQGDRDSAVRFYELCLAMGTDNAELVGESAYRAGEIRFAQGDLAAATAHLVHALESGHEGFADQARVLLGKLNA